MTYEEALDKMSNLAVTYSQIDADTCELFTIAKEALKKQIREKPEIDEFEGTDYWQGRYSHRQYSCPYCGMRLDTHFDCCCNCGQALDWSDKK